VIVIVAVVALGVVVAALGAVIAVVGSVSGAAVVCV
jgi:hypothetical protein